MFVSTLLLFGVLMALFTLYVKIVQEETKLSKEVITMLEEHLAATDEIISGFVAQTAIAEEDGSLSSGFLSTVADGIRWLAFRKVMKYYDEPRGRYARAEWVKADNENNTDKNNHNAEARA